MEEKTPEEIAQERIEEALSTNSRFLDLSGCGLLDIPEDIGELTNLTTLKMGVNISDGWRKIRLNHISRLPKSFGKLVNLTELDLTGNTISELPTQIFEVPNIKSLYLGANNLAEISEDINYLKKLTTLDLSGNNLGAFPKEICSLTSLEFLNLGANKLYELPIEIGNLTNLRSLCLVDNFIEEFSAGALQFYLLENLLVSRNQLTKLPPDIGNLHKLEYLYLSENKISNLPPDIGKLRNLIHLDLSDNQLENLPNEIGELTNLRVLSLTSNRLVNISSSVGKLQGLHRLGLGKNKIKKLPNEIGGLKSLQFLFLNNNLLIELPPSIGYLTDLNKIDASHNQLKKLPNEIGRLANLRSIDLSNNKIVFLPQELGNLHELKSLLLNNNKITLLPHTIGNLRKIRTLMLSNNKINIIPDNIENLVDLELFYLDDNQIESIPTQIGFLENLFGFKIGNNQISKLPKQLRKIKTLEILALQNNQLSLANEILSRTDDARLILEAYFTSKKRLNEAKCLIVGQGSVGKTSIAKRLIKNNFSITQGKTEGISIRHLSLENRERLENREKIENREKKELQKRLEVLQRALLQNPESEKVNRQIKSVRNLIEGKLADDIALNIWDFGGQEIMHATHQFFLTKRSLYLLVLDSRLTQEENRVEYWLKIIQSFGGDSPVLIVGNKIDQHPLDIDETGLQRKYPNIVGILKTSAATGTGIEELKSAITDQVNNLSHVRDLLPETWFIAKNELEKLGQEENFITQDKYFELCTENEINDETSQRTLIGFLHDLGVVLHFQDDPRLERLGILNPQWVTNGVYKILNSHELFKNKGVLERSMLNEILDAPEYPSNKRLFIIDMMRKFELCYDLVTDQKFLVPDLLPKDEPQRAFNGIPAFEYAYPVLPSSIITRFIVRMNQKIDDGFVWRTGVMLKIGENKALVKADIEDKKITIAIDGLEHTRRDALSAIRYQLDEIHASIKGLNPQKRVPVPNAPNGEALEYDYLLMLEREGQETHLVKDGARLVKVNVREILSGIESESQRRERGGTVTNIYVNGNFDGNLTVGDGNQAYKDSYNKITSASIDPELKETLALLVEAVAAMNESLPEEQAAETTEDLGKLVEEATKSKPNKRWYSVSIEGLIRAAENLDKLGEPVISLSKKVLSLLTGGLIK